MRRFQWFQQGVLPVLMAGSCLWVCDAASAGRRFSQSTVTSTRVKTPSPARDKKTDRPEWTEIEKTVKATLAQTKDYRPGDLITQKDAAPIFPALKSQGWEVKSSKEVTKHLLTDSDEMVRELRGQPERKFMRKIGSVPGGYDRLDKLRKLPYGSRRVKELMNDPGGSALIEYMATTPGGKEMGRQLSSIKQGNNFNAPTKRIYTESDLLNALKGIYEVESSPSSR